jgi:hypothetical protein
VLRRNDDSAGALRLQGGDARAVYYAQFSNNHPDGVVAMLVSIGEWGEGTTPADRVAFAMEFARRRRPVRRRCHRRIRESMALCRGRRADPRPAGSSRAPPGARGVPDRRPRTRRRRAAGGVLRAVSVFAAELNTTKARLKPQSGGWGSTGRAESPDRTSPFAALPRDHIRPFKSAVPASGTSPRPRRSESPGPSQVRGSLSSGGV